MSEQVIVVHYRIQHGHEAAAVELFTRLAGASEAEPGCLAFRAHQSVDDPQEFVLYERYRDQQALEAHRRSEHFATLVTTGLYPLLKHRDPHQYRPLPPAATSNERSA